MKKKKIVCLTGPSGVGKSFYAELLVEKLNLARPTTVTTRKPRVDDGNHVYVSRELFSEMIEKGLFMEWDEYGGNFYGITFDNLQGLLESEKYEGVAMDLTPRICGEIKDKLPGAIIIALLPDEIAWLEQRLVRRGTNTAAETMKRLKMAENDIEEVKKLKNASIVYCRYNPACTSEVFGKIIEIIEKESKR